MIDVWFNQVPTLNGGKRPVVELHCANNAEALEVLNKLKTARLFDSSLNRLVNWPTVDRSVDATKQAAQW